MSRLQPQQAQSPAPAVVPAAVTTAVPAAAPLLEPAQRSGERQQAAVARLGRLALGGLSGQALFDAAVREVADGLQVSHVGLCRLVGERFSFDAGVGWRDGVVGSTGPIPAPGSMALFMATAKAPVVYDAARETRFSVHELVTTHGLRAGILANVPGRRQSWGILGAHSTAPRAFSPEDAAFVDAVAQVIASAVQRAEFEDELRASRQHLEQVVAQRTRQLEASNRELEAFSYSVSHDLRAPLRTIAGYAGLLEARHGHSLTPETRPLVEGLRRAAERMGDLIDDLLDLSRVQRVDLVRQEVDLSALAEAQLRQRAADEPGRDVQWTVQPGIVVEGDPRLLSMLLDNLLGNAWKFTRGTPGARIAVAQRPGDHGPVLCVRDNGAGFDMALAGRLFQPFQRLHHPSEFDGTGIGLATVQRIAERHGGRVWAEARVGQGAAFYVTLGPAGAGAG